MSKIRVLLAALLTVLAMMTSGCIVIPISLPGAGEMKQVVYEEGTGINPKKIAIIDVSGVLMGGGEGEGFFSSDSSVVDLTRKLALAKKDKTIKAVILRVDSPGGGVTASDVMYRELSRFREDSGIPVYVSMQTVAASGGYYISMAADKVYANPTTVTGSIGVIATFPEFRGLMDRFGVEMNSITSGKNKDAGAFYKKMTPEEHALYQSLIDDMYGKFVAVVSKNRKNLSEAKVRELADGRVYTASQAQAVGLIDGVAYLDELVEIIQKDQNLTKKPRVVLIKRSGRDTTESMYANARNSARATGQPVTQFNMIHVDSNMWSAHTNEAFNFLWVP